MGDIIIFKAPQHMGNRIDFTNICQELIAQTLALCCAPHEPSNINKFELGWQTLCRACKLRQLIKACIWNSNSARIWLDCAERVVGCFCCSCFCQRIKQGRFTNIRQSNDPAIKPHNLCSCLIKYMNAPDEQADGSSHYLLVLVLVRAQGRQHVT